MKLPVPLLRGKLDSYKNQFGHVGVLAGSRNMLGAAALTSLAALRSGAGLVTVAVPQGLNKTAHKKIAHEIMTLPLKATRQETPSLASFEQIRQNYGRFDVLAVGPGLSRHPSTQRLVLKILATCPKPLVVDADALYALIGHDDVLQKTGIAKILTPHLEEMARLIHRHKNEVANNCRQLALEFAQRHHCVVVLKGHRSLVASGEGEIYINTTGNPGMATAGSGDVLTGMIASLLGQGLPAFDAAKWATYWHGKAGDLAAKRKTRAAMIASDIIDYIPEALRRMQWSR